MSKRNYAWKRFWCPREGSLDLTQRGFLTVPDQERSYHDSDVVPFESISDRQCLVLLGEPGIGKSTALHGHFEVLAERTLQEDTITLFRDLRDYASEERLINEVFGSPEFLQWEAGDSELHLFLDSLDECQLHLETVPRILVGQLSRLKTRDHLFVRIACRTMAWPLYLEEELKTLWAPESVKVYELAPLREQDIRLAAEQNSIDPDAFVQQVADVGAVPLAAKPVTLQFLLNTFQRSGEITASKWDLYRDGCRILCEETPSRRPSHAGSYTASERLEAATQIAAATILAGYSAIWKEIDLGDVPAGNLTVTELARASGKPGLHELLIRETLGTGLFTARGPSQMGWAHQTYGEFLAAYYLLENGLAFEQIMSLLAHPDDSLGRIIPQLRETTAWIATRQPQVFDHLVRSDPDVLFRSEVIDLSTVDAEIQAQLLANYLELYKSRQQFNRGLQPKYYHKLSYPALESQLKRYIDDENNNLYVRRAAIEIATACGLASLEDMLVKIALDPSQEYLREDAAYAVLQTGSAAARRALRPLAFGQAGPDDYDELKGIGLLAVWPDHLTPTELFQTLCLPKRDSLIGMYHRFLTSNPIQHLTTSDLPLALEWAAQQDIDRQHDRLQSIVNAIILKAWDNLDEHNVLEAFARVAVVRLLISSPLVESLYHGEPINSLEARTAGFSNEIMSSHSKRRQLLVAVIPLLKNHEEETFWLARSTTPLVTPDDLPWLISQLSTADEAYREAYLRLIERVINVWSVEHLDSIFYAIDSDQLPERFKIYLTIPVHSPGADWARQVLESERKRQEFEHKQRQQTYQLLEDIQGLLAQCEDEASDAWCKLNRLLVAQVDAVGAFPPVYDALNLSAHPVWEMLSDEQKLQIVDSAQRYVMAFELKTVEWLAEYLSKGRVYHSVYSGIRALLITEHYRPGFISKLPSAVCERWAPFVSSYPFSHEDSGLLSKLVYQVYKKAPEQMIDTVLKIINGEISNHGNVYIPPRFEYCWDERFQDAILQCAKVEDVPPEVLSTLLQQLAVHGSDSASAFAKALVQAPFDDDPDKLQRAVIGASILIEHADELGRQAAWSAFRHSEKFADLLIHRIAASDAGWRLSFQNKLSAAELLSLYTWLEKRYPHSEDPQIEGGHIVTEREHIGWFRDSILETLMDAGTPDAAACLSEIVHQFPEDRHWYALSRSQENLRRSTWNPPSPGVIFELAKSEEGKLVNNGDQLLEVVIASLSSLEEELQGETYAAVDLWDTYVKRPKGEEDFSDYIKRFLQRDLTRQGIVLNREVKIRPGTGGAAGERTDIHVDAVVNRQSECETVSLIIEIKGVWNEGLLEAMQTQLVERYLADNRCHHGLYLVGWFNCAQWDRGDTRRSRAQRYTDIHELRRILEEQASVLSRDKLSVRAIVINASLR